MEIFNSNHAGNCIVLVSISYDEISNLKAFPFSVKQNHKVEDMDHSIACLYISVNDLWEFIYVIISRTENFNHICSAPNLTLFSECSQNESVWTWEVSSEDFFRHDMVQKDVTDTIQSDQFWQHLKWVAIFSRQHLDKSFECTVGRCEDGQFSIRVSQCFSKTSRLDGGTKRRECRGTACDIGDRVTVAFVLGGFLCGVVHR
mmetsp:Transcript_39168/g.94701  ORF Transcript_39168/g.94701 Transcript_39168/m.94701 type:complete len:202 (+) Transcript_39168:135-740(+)